MNADIPPALLHEFVTSQDIPQVLAPGALVGKKVTFIRCTGCGNDGRLYVDDCFLMNCRKHKAWRELLPFLQAACSDGDFRQIRRDINGATWMRDYEPIPGMLVTATARDVERYATQAAEDSLLDWFFRLGGDDR